MSALVSPPLSPPRPLSPPLNVDDSDASTTPSPFPPSYLTWKKNTPFLFDLVFTHRLDWPSLSVEYFPDRITPEGKDYAVQRILCGTQTNGEEPNFIRIMESRMPIDTNGDAIIAATTTTNANEDAISPNFHHGVKVDISQSIPHGQYDVNRCRLCPSNPNIIASRPSSLGEIFLFDRTKHPSQPPHDMMAQFRDTSNPMRAVRPDLRFSGHVGDGFGLTWNSHVEGEIASCGFHDNAINVYSINGPQVTSFYSVVAPTKSYSGGLHTKGINDVEYSHIHPFLLGSVGEDGLIGIWDTRRDSHCGEVGTSSSTSPSPSSPTHVGPINGISFSPFSEFLFSTASSDHSVRVWDLRSLKASIHTLVGHSDEVYNVRWCPFNSDLLASGSGDNHIVVWDLNRIGCRQSEEDRNDGPPELLFRHAGHCDRIGDLSWNPCAEEEFVIASTADDNSLHIWKMAENIHLSGKDGRAKEGDGDKENVKKGNIVIDCVDDVIMK